VSAARDLLRRFGSGLFADAAFGGRPTDLRFLEGFSGRPPISLKYSSRSSCAPSLRGCQCIFGRESQLQEPYRFSSGSRVSSLGSS
jgi:hypothetical protein